MAGLDENNRMVIQPTNVDVQRDTAFAAYVNVSVLQLVDRAGNEVQFLFNTTTTSIDPNADTTYDAAPINSLFFNGISAAAATNIYIKETATAWRALA